MSRTMRLTIDSATVRPSKAVKVAAWAGPLVILTERALRDLADELGGYEAALRHLLRVAENVGKPIAANVETGEGCSSTMFVAPRCWTPDRLRGWIGGHHEAFEAMFGAATLTE
jgi:hypothetical protein